MAYLTSLAISISTGNTTDRIDLENHHYSIGRNGNIETHRFIQCISRLHCSLQRNTLLDKEWKIRDLNSHCGTKVNNVEIGKRDIILQHGDIITVGVEKFAVDFFYHQD